MRSLRLTLAYDGTKFSGWQWQPERRTVQGVLEEAVYRVSRERRRVVASGRTDAGVHALGQAVSLNTESELPAETWCRALNANLPSDVVVRDACEAPADFNAIDDARSKRYRYVMQIGRVVDIFARHYVWHFRGDLELSVMQAAATHLVGRQDFKSLESAGSRRVSTVRRVMDVSLSEREVEFGRQIVFEVEADGFLYNMVRNMVGTLVEVGRGKQDADWIPSLLEARDRRLAGMTAPPQGLYLRYVVFDF